MTLQEAVKSGKKFKRKGDEWVVLRKHPDVDTLVYRFENSNNELVFSKEDFLATDWKIEKKICKCK